MAYTNEAYDLELFRPRKPKLVALSNNKKLQETKKKQVRRQAFLNTAAILALAIFALGLVAYFITCNVRLTEMNKSINDAQTELNTLQSEQVRLQAELAGLTSAEQINNYAQEHGMLPVDSNQVYYIQADGEDEVWLAEKGEGWFARAWKSLWNFLS